MKKYGIILIVLAMGASAWALPPYNQPGKSEVAVDQLVVTGVTPGNIPYMQAAGAGFGDSPLSTDGTNVVNTGTYTGSTIIGGTTTTSDLNLKTTTGSRRDRGRYALLGWQ